MKYLTLLLAVVFLLFAAVQYNDPDPIHWIALYLYTAAICGFAAFGKFNKYALWAELAVTTVWVALTIPDFIDWIKMGEPNIAGQMKATEPYIEMTREFLGVLMCWFVVLWQLWRVRKK